MAKVYDTATDLITFARLQAQNTTSGSSYLGSDGLLKFAAEDEPRIEYAADGSLKGLLIEEQRTNLIMYSEDFSNAAWDKVGTVAIDSTLVTGPDGTLSGRRVLNFDDAAGDRLVEVVPITNATLTASVWVKGEGDNIGKDIQLTAKRAGGTFAGASVIHTLTADWARIHATFTQDPTNTGANIVLNNPNNGNEASEVLIYGFQLEEGSFATSYIPTSGSQSTRSPDIASIPVSAFGYNQEAGTVVAEYSMNAGAFSASPYIVQFDNGTSSTRYLLMELSNQSRFFMAVSGTTQDTIVNEPISEGVLNKTAVAFVENSTGVSTNGSVAESGDGTSSVPSGITTVRLGMSVTQNHLNGHLKSLKYFPRRLTDAQLQELTA